MSWKPAYVELAAAKRYMSTGLSDEDDLIQLYIDTASRAVDDHCNRQFGKLDSPAEWAYTAYYDSERCLWVVPIDDVQDPTGLTATIDGGDAIDAYTLEPRNAVDQGKAYTRLVVKSTSTGQPTGAEGEVLISVGWGWTAIPATVTHATDLQLNRFSARRKSPFGIAGSPEQGNELRLLARLDADVITSLRGYRRTRRLG